MILGIREAVKTSVLKNNETNYATNYGTALATGILGVLISTIGVLLYIEFIEPEFLQEMNDNFLIGGDLSLYEVVFSLFVEGLASVIVGSLMVMQFYKNHGKSEA